MLKSELVNYLRWLIAENGDGEIQVEVTSNLNFMGKIYPVYDVVSTSEGDLIMCFVDPIEKPDT